MRRIGNALKHGGYTATTLLPGEDRAAFEELHQALIAELAPVGVLEEDTVSTIARVLWRKKNLSTFQLAALARAQLNEIKYEKKARHNFDVRGSALKKIELPELKPAKNWETRFCTPQRSGAMNRAAWLQTAGCRSFGTYSAAGRRGTYR